MAENPKFNNISMFKDVTNNTGHTDIDADNKSEVLATQGNVINSIKTFWNSLRRKLVYAITRTDTSKAVGGKYHPIFVNEDGGVQVCNPTTLPGSVTNNNINLDQIKPLYPGQIVCITVTNTTANNTSFLTINNKNVYYPTGAQVKVSDVSNNTTYLFTFISGDGDKWILNNKINVVMPSSKSSENETGNGGNPGLMTADDKAKLDKIAWGANNFTYTLPTASANKKGGVKSSSNTDSDNNRKIYHVGVDNNGIMTVNVPWQNTHNEASLSLVTDSNNYPIIRLTDGNNTTNIPITSAGGASVYINNNTLVIEAPQLIEYSILKTDSFNKNNSSSLPYTVYGPGPTNATTNYYLAGNGTWVRGILVPIPGNGASGRILKCNESGTPYWANAE